MLVSLSLAVTQLPCFVAEVKPSSLLHLLSSKVFHATPQWSKLTAKKGEENEG